MTVLNPATGKEFNWNSPPKPNVLAHWSEKTSGGKTVIGSVRTVAHLDAMDAAAKKKGYSQGIQVIQSSYNTGVKASAGTHDYDACIDLWIPGVGWRDAEKWCRSQGFGCWYRHSPDFPSQHVHGFTLPPQGPGTNRSMDFKNAGLKVGLYVDGGISLYGSARSSSQIADYYAHAYGLAGQHGKNSDTAWYPTNIKSTIFDLNAYIKARSWKPDMTMKSSLAAVQEQFQIVQGTRKGTLVRQNGMGHIQVSLNAAIKAGLSVTGICDKATVAAWKTWETKHPGTGAKGTPDPTSLKAMGIVSLFTGPEAK